MSSDVSALHGNLAAANETWPGLEPLIRSASMRELYELVARVAPTPLSVLVRGETGSGKELIAHAVHARSPRRAAPFKVLNCAAIPASLVESALFGHERGAFTGAERQIQGVFEQARGGTVFLDEIGELAPQAQAALLRVLEEGHIVRVGGCCEIPIDARVVAATHRDLEAMVAEGAFRQDLLFRIDAFALQVPPLRERKEEIIPLAELFRQRVCHHGGAPPPRHISSEAAHALLTYHWPGNVRQLKNAIERACAVCAGDSIRAEHLPEPLSGQRKSALRAAPLATEGAPTLPERLRAFERELLREALREARGNRTQAARALGIPRRTLTHKLQSHGLSSAVDEARAVIVTLPARPARK